MVLYGNKRLPHFLWEKPEGIPWNVNFLNIKILCIVVNSAFVPQFHIIDTNRGVEVGQKFHILGCFLQVTFSFIGIIYYDIIKRYYAKLLAIFEGGNILYGGNTL